MKPYLHAALFVLVTAGCSKSATEVSESPIPESSTQSSMEANLEPATLASPAQQKLQRSTEESSKAVTPTFRLLLFGLSRGGPQANVKVRVCKESFWLSESNQNAWSTQSKPSEQILQLPFTMSGGDGIVPIPVPTSEAIMVVAERNGRWIWQRFEQAKADAIVPMAFPDEASFGVRVLDQDGNPAPGVSVQPFVGAMSTMEIETGAENRLSRTPDGIVFLSDIKLFRDITKDMSARFAKDAGQEPPPPPPLRAYANILSIESMFVDLPLPATQGFIDLHLGPSGSLHVDINGVEHASGSVSISGSADAPNFHGTRINDIPFEDGVVDIPYIGLGLDLSIVIKLQGESGTRRIKVQGPQTAGDRVQASLTIDPTMVISGRLLDSRARPISKDRLARAMQRSARNEKLKPPSLALFTGQLSPRWQPLSLDDEGRFRAIINTKRLGKKVYALQVEFAGKTFSWSGEIPVAPSETDLGDVQLGSGPSLLAGMVVDGQGNGIAGARLTLEFEKETQYGMRWTKYPGAKLVSAKDGSFRVPLSYAGGSGRLTAVHDAYSQIEPLTVQAGNMDTQVLMAMGGELLFTYSSPPGFNHYNLALILTGSQGVVKIEPEDGYFSSDLDHFRYRGIPAGEYDLTLKYSYYEEEILSFSGVTVRAGELCDDPRLNEVDISVGLRQVGLVIRNASGEPISDYSLYIVQDGKPDYIPGVGGEKNLWVPLRAQFDVVVYADEYGTGEQENIASTIDVTLSKIRTARFQVAEGTQLETPGGRLHLMLQREVELSGFDYQFMPWYPQAIGEDLLYSSPVPGPGRYTLYWQQGEERRKGKFSTSVVLTEEDLDGVITVHPPNGFQ